MGRENTVKYKSFEFAKRVVKLHKYLCDEKKEFVLSKQLLRSGTSIGANITKAECGVSRKDFLAKMYIAFKECAETGYWLELLHSCDYLSRYEFNSIFSECEELRRMLSAITKTTRDNSSSLTSNSSLGETEHSG